MRIDFYSLSLACLHFPLQPMYGPMVVPQVMIQFKLHVKWPRMESRFTQLGVSQLFHIHVSHSKMMHWVRQSVWVKGGYCTKLKLHLLLSYFVVIMLLHRWCKGFSGKQDTDYYIIQHLALWLLLLACLSLYIYYICRCCCVHSMYIKRTQYYYTFQGNRQIKTSLSWN